MPPNQCGVYFDGFYPEDFGRWEFSMETSINRIKGNTLIDFVEGPCDIKNHGKYRAIMFYPSL